MVPNDLIYGAYNMRVHVDVPGAGTIPVSWGTAFGLQFPPIHVMPTARHVVDALFYDYEKYKGSTLMEVEVRGRHLHDDGTPSGYFGTVFDQFGMCWPADGVSDVAVVFAFKPKAGHEKISIQEYGGVHIPNAESLATLPVGARIGAIGYPQHHNEVDLRPLFRAGSVASDPRYNHAIVRPPSDVQQDLGRVVAYDGFSWGGLSGAPVFWHDSELPQPFLVGVNAGHLPANPERGIRGHSGLSYFYRFDVLAELLNSLFRVMRYEDPCTTYGASKSIIMMTRSAQPMSPQEVQVPAQVILPRP